MKTESLTESLIDSQKSNISNPSPETASSAVPESSDGLAALRQMEAELSAGKKSSTAPGESVASESPAASEPLGRTPRRKKFKKLNPEHTIRLTLRQYWRFRDWMARRQLGLPSDYSGVFIQGKDSAIIEPLIDPLISCMDCYLPDEWVVMFEEKAPILQLLIALFETESIFQGQVAQAAKEIKMRAGDIDRSAAATVNDEQKPVFPSLKETVGTEGRRTA